MEVAGLRDGRTLQSAAAQWSWRVRAVVWPYCGVPRRRYSVRHARCVGGGGSRCGAVAVDVWTIACRRSSSSSCHTDLIVLTHHPPRGAVGTARDRHHVDACGGHVAAVRGSGKQRRIRAMASRTAVVTWQWKARPRPGRQTRRFGWCPLISRAPGATASPLLFSKCQNHA
jgi:hypothetical protein